MEYLSNLFKYLVQNNFAAAEKKLITIIKNILNRHPLKPKKGDSVAVKDYLTISFLCFSFDNFFRDNFPKALNDTTKKNFSSYVYNKYLVSLVGTPKQCLISFKHIKLFTLELTFLLCRSRNSRSLESIRKQSIPEYFKGYVKIAPTRLMLFLN